MVHRLGCRWLFAALRSARLSQDFLDVLACLFVGLAFVGVNPLPGLCCIALFLALLYAVDNVRARDSDGPRVATFFFAILFLGSLQQVCSRHQLAEPEGRAHPPIRPYPSLIARWLAFLKRPRSLRAIRRRSKSPQNQWLRDPHQPKRSHRRLCQRWLGLCDRQNPARRSRPPNRDAAPPFIHVQGWKGRLSDAPDGD